MLIKLRTNNITKKVKYSSSLCYTGTCSYLFIELLSLSLSLYFSWCFFLMLDYLFSLLICITYFYHCSSYSYFLISFVFLFIYLYYPHYLNSLFVCLKKYLFILLFTFMCSYFPLWYGINTFFLLSTHMYK